MAERRGSNSSATGQRRRSASSSKGKIKTDSKSDEAIEHDVGLASAQGRRATMEDVHVVSRVSLAQGETSLQSARLFAVFDGHGGRRCAELAAQFLPGMIASHIHGTSASDEQVFEGITRAYADCEVKIELWHKREGFWSGTTAAVALMLSDGRVFVSNIGDSRVVYGDVSGAAERLSVDHEPNLPEEKKRVEDAGGYVACNRILMTLSVSRCFGDFEMRYPWNTKERKQATASYVISDPHQRLLDLTSAKPAPSILLITCDGVWERKIQDEASVMKRLVDGRAAGKSPQDLAEDLVASSLKAGSNDNVSVLVVFLESPGTATDSPAS